MIVPVVIEKSDYGERAYDIYSRLLKERIIFAGDQIGDDMANTIIAQVLYLESKDPEKDISLYVNSPGGSVTAGLALNDTIQYIKSDLSVICMGQAFGTAALLLAAGTKGKRYALPHARFMIHQPIGGVEGQATDMDIRAKEMLKIKTTFHRVFAQHTGQPVERIAQDMERDFFMGSDEAIKYGLIDKVITERVMADKGKNETQTEREVKRI